MNLPDKAWLEDDRDNCLEDCDCCNITECPRWEAKKEDDDEEE